MTSQSEWREMHYCLKTLLKEFDQNSFNVRDLTSSVDNEGTQSRQLSTLTPTETLKLLLPGGSFTESNPSSNLARLPACLSPHDPGSVPKDLHVDAAGAAGVSHHVDLAEFSLSERSN